MNVVKYDNFTFDDTSIISGKLNLANALAFDSLVPDEMTVEVYSNATGKKKLLTVNSEWYTTTDGRGYVIALGDIRSYTYGTPVEYYYDDALIGKFYLKNVVRLSPSTWRINMLSAVGLWVNMVHLGGVYNGTTAGTIIADILDGMTYEIDSDVAAVKMYGYLPVASARDNLQQVLFAIGASVTKTSAGTPKIEFLDNLSTVSLPDSRVFLGSSIDYRTPATEIEVTEHSYYQSSLSQTISLYDNTDGSGVAEDLLVTFSDPCYDLIWDDGTQTSVSDLGWECGDNYCYVTGTGILTGKPYGHSTKTFSVPTEQSGVSNIKRVQNATLVSALNSANVAARLTDYYGTAESVSCGIALTSNDIKPCSKVAFTDPYDQTSSTGIVESMDVTLSGKLKAECSILKNYTPGHFGNNYTNYRRFITGTTQTWTVPSGVSSIRIILVQGGQAGQNGTAGESSYTPTFSFDPSPSPGAGGVGGAGGSGGKIFVTDIENPSGTVTVNLGLGGTPGDGDGAIGNYGGETTLTVNGVTYSSADGYVPEDGYIEIFTGHTISYKGKDGIDGASGGDFGKQGGDVTYEGTTWTGGSVGEGYDYNNPNYTRYANGGAGGGAAYGANGGDGGDWEWPASQSAYWRRGGAGGKGADALQLPAPRLGGNGGAGGCGGGGGGLGGTYRYEEKTGDRSGYGKNGAGGAASLGRAGGRGCVYIYY